MSALSKVKHLMMSLVLIFAFIMSTEARAALYGFEAVSNNSGVSGEMALQLSVDVTDSETTDPDNGYNQVLFTFYNDGPLNSIYDVDDPPLDGIITGVYFEDGELLYLAKIHDYQYDSLLYPEVDFGQPVVPPVLPNGGELDPQFEVTAAFSVDSEKNKEENLDPMTNGVGPGESLSLLYTLKDGKDFDDVLTALSFGMTDPAPGAGTSLRIGLFVQNLGGDMNGDGVPGDYSDTFITPVPASVILGMLGLGVVGLKLRKFA